MKVSFVVPAYNAEETLDACVSSLLSQGLEAETFEILVVDDGSTDGTKAIGQKYAGTFPGITLVSQQNQGLSAARNVGIAHARGAYICFVDADDYLVPEGVASILGCCDGKHDLVRFWSKIIHPGTPPAQDGDGSVVFQGRGMAYLRQFGLETFCWNYLYRKDFLEEKQLRFRPGILGEDFAFMFDVMMADPAIISLARQIYCYVIQPGSISTTRSVAHSRRWVEDLTGTMVRISDALRPYQKTDPALYDRCRRSLDAKMVALFSRVLSARYSRAEYGTFLAVCREAGLLPVRSPARSFRERILFTMVSALSKYTGLYPAASSLFTGIVLPYVYPVIDRNG